MYGGWIDDNSFTLKPRVKNDGNVSIDTEIQTVTSGILGDSKDIQTQQYPILRNATSDWAIPYKPSFWGGWYRSHFTATYDSNVANGIGETTNKNLVTLQSETIYFFVPPHPAALLLEIFILIIIGFGLFKFWLFWKRRKKTVEEWEVIIIDSQTDIVTLAEKFGVSWKLMAKVNKLKAPYILRPGDAIRVPAQIANAAGAAPSHDIKIITLEKPTDITAVAREHGVAWKKLAKLNKLKEPYILRPGDMIKVPVGGQSNMDKLKKVVKRQPKPRMEPVIVDKHTDIVTFAELYGLEWKELAKLNKLKAPYILKPGYVVMVPAGSSPGAQSQSSATDVQNAPQTAPAGQVVAEAPTAAHEPPQSVEPAVVAPEPSAEPTVQQQPITSEPTQQTAPPVPQEQVIPPAQAPVAVEQSAPQTNASAPTENTPSAPAVVAPQTTSAPPVASAEPEHTPNPQPVVDNSDPAEVVVTMPEQSATQNSPASQQSPTTQDPIVIHPTYKKPAQQPEVHKPKVVKIQDVKKVSHHKPVGQHGRAHTSTQSEENHSATRPPD